MVIAASALAALGILLAGCGHTATVGRYRTLRVALTEYRIAPQKVETTAGELTILVHNVGKLTHNLAISQGSQVVDETPPIWPGTTGELVVVLTPGTYTMGSTLFSDQALGEYGTLTITR